MKKEVMIPIYIALIIILTLLGGQKIYEKGLIDGLTEICEKQGLKPGITSKGEYTCYNPEENEQKYEITNYEEIKWQ